MNIYFVLNTVGMGIDLVASAYTRLLSRGLNRIPTAVDIVDYVVSSGEGLGDVRLYVTRGELERMMREVNMAPVDRGDSLIFTLGGMDALEVPRESWVQGADLLRITWIDVNAMRIGGVEIRLIDLGSPDPIECSSVIVDRVKSMIPSALGTP
jgi:hypothetical protein